MNILLYYVYYVLHYVFIMIHKIYKNDNRNSNLLKRDKKECYL